MEAAKHTPGPWFVLPLSTTVPTSRGPGSFSIGTSERATAANILCSRSPWEERADEMTANARLIAAAPELLAVLQSIVTLLDEHPRAPRIFDAAYDDAGLAIAKATGASA